jgi:hypothetical protein
MKSIFYLFFFFLFLSIGNLSVSAAECTLGIDDVKFSPFNGSITNKIVQLNIDSTQCKDNTLKVVLVAYNTTADTVDISNRSGEHAVYTKTKGGIVNIKYQANDEECFGARNPDCQIYVEVYDNTGKSVYSSKSQIAKIITEISSKKDEAEIEQIKNSNNFRNGILFADCSNVYCGSTDWKVMGVTGGEEVDKNGIIVPTNTSNVIPQKPPVDASSPCYDPKTDSYTETCYEFLAPLPGFESTQSDGKTSNIKTNTDGRTSIIDVRQFKIGDFVNSMFQISLGILMVLCVVMIIMDGVSYMMSEVPFVKSMAKGRIGNALMGLLLALSIYTILWTINPKLLEVNFGDGIETVKIQLDPEDGDGGVPNTQSNVKVGSKTQTCPEGLVNIQGILVCKRISNSFEKLITDAKKSGVPLGGYGARSYESQVALRRQNCPKSGFDIYKGPSSQCVPQTARPGYSRHESGLAIDFTCSGQTIKSNNVCFQWLSVNAGKYGFYNLPKEKWHWSIDGK